VIEQGFAWYVDNKNCPYHYFQPINAGGTLTSFTGPGGEGLSKANLTVSNGVAKGKLTWLPHYTDGMDWDIQFSVKPTATGLAARPNRMK